MQTLYLVIVDNGDGSQGLEYRRLMTQEIKKNLANHYSGRYESGDGVQIREFKFNDLDAWASLNKITWDDGCENDGEYDA